MLYVEFNCTVAYILKSNFEISQFLFELKHFPLSFFYFVAPPKIHPVKYLIFLFLYMLQADMPWHDAKRKFQLIQFFRKIKRKLYFFSFYFNCTSKRCHLMANINLYQKYQMSQHAFYTSSQCFGDIIVSNVCS